MSQLSFRCLAVVLPLRCSRVATLKNHFCSVESNSFAFSIPLHAKVNNNNDNRSEWRRNRTTFFYVLSTERSDGSAGRHRNMPWEKRKFFVLTSSSLFVLFQFVNIRRQRNSSGQVEANVSIFVARWHRQTCPVECQATIRAEAVELVPRSPAVVHRFSPNRIRCWSTRAAEVCLWSLSGHRNRTLNINCLVLFLGHRHNKQPSEVERSDTERSAPVRLSLSRSARLEARGEWDYADGPWKRQQPGAARRPEKWRRRGRRSGRRTRQALPAHSEATGGQKRCPAPGPAARQADPWHFSSSCLFTEDLALWKYRISFSTPHYRFQSTVIWEFIPQSPSTFRESFPSAWRRTIFQICSTFSSSRKTIRRRNKAKEKHRRANQNLIAASFAGACLFFFGELSLPSFSSFAFQCAPFDFGNWIHQLVFVLALVSLMDAS